MIVESDEAPSFPWYGETGANDLEQGDFLSSLPVFETPYPTALQAGAQVRATAKIYDVIVLSQSCDLLAGKIENVLVAPHFSLSDAREAIPTLKDVNRCEDTRRGYLHSFHLLNACEIQGYESEVRVVSFRQVFTVPLNYALAQTTGNKERLRLLPPYREHLAQAFARFVMRVGLPQDIPPFKK